MATAAADELPDVIVEFTVPPVVTVVVGAEVTAVPSLPVLVATVKLSTYSDNPFTAALSAVPAAAVVVVVAPAAVVVLTTVAVDVEDAVKHGIYDGVSTHTAVPVYAAVQHGLVVLGGARPPPQSSGSQICPSSGSYQCTMPSAQEPYVCVAQPTAEALRAAARSRTARVERVCMVIVFS